MHDAKEISLGLVRPSPSDQNLLDQATEKYEACDTLGDIEAVPKADHDATFWDVMQRRSFDGTRLQEAMPRLNTKLDAMTAAVTEEGADVTFWDVMQRRSFDGVGHQVISRPLDSTPAQTFTRRTSLDQVPYVGGFKPDIDISGGANEAHKKSEIGPLDWSGRFCGGLIADVKRRAPFYVSDWTEAFTPADNLSKTVASVIFLFFACLSPAVAFGTLFSDYTEGQLGVIEMILSSGMSGVFYAFFAGQPLCILGATGPELAYSIVFWNMCKSFDVEFLPARVWEGLWTALFTILLSVTDCCALMRHVTRFTEEIFSAVISAIFIIEAFLAVAKLYMDGNGHDQAFMGTVICFGTYGVATWFKNNRTSNLFTAVVRNMLANYGVTVAIVMFSALAAAFPSVGTEMLAVPDTFRPTWDNPETGEARHWIVNPMGINKDFPMWAILATALPALGLTFLGYMDQNLTSLLINRKDHKLRKPPGYHLDLFVCGVFIYPLCGFLGLPFTHAATVRSMTHMVSLTNYKHIALEGGGAQQVVNDVVEQRISNLCIHILIFMSLLLAPVLRMVPKSVLFGVFLFMGVGSMAGNQLFDRIALLFVWDSEKFPKYSYVKKVDTWRMHQFTLFQFAMLVILYVLTRIDAISVVFPFFIGLLVFVRKGLGFYFTDAELAALDS